jgi:hypothetical protein
MTRGSMDPARLDGEALDRWYRRSPEEIAKGGGYQGLLSRADRSTFGKFVRGGLASQADRQSGIAGGRPIDWHVAELLAAAAFRKDDIAGGRPITILDDPPR